MNRRCPRPIHFATVDLDALIAAGKDKPGYRFVCSTCGEPGTTQVTPIWTGGFRDRK